MKLAMLTSLTGNPTDIGATEKKGKFCDAVQKCRQSRIYCLVLLLLLRNKGTLCKQMKFPKVDIMIQEVFAF